MYAMDVRHGCTPWMYARSPGGPQNETDGSQSDPQHDPKHGPKKGPKHEISAIECLYSTGSTRDGIKVFFGRFEYIATSRIWPRALLSITGGCLITSRNYYLPQAPANNPSPALQSSPNIIFPKLESVSAAVLLLVREKTSRFTTVRVSTFIHTYFFNKPKQ